VFYRGCILNSYPLFSKRAWRSLDGIWDFHFVGEDATLESLDLASVLFDDRLSVPGVFDVTPAYAGQRGLALYRHKVTTPADRRMKLRFGGIGLWAMVFWDGQQVGTIDLPYSGVEIGFPSGPEGEHVLVVAIDNRFDFRRTPLFSQFYDFYAYGGFYRGVELHELPACSLERVRIRTRDIATGTVALDIEVSGNIPETLDFTVAFDQHPPMRVSRTVRDRHVQLDLAVPAFRCWSPKSPNLHTVTVTLAEDAVTERFGIRTVTADGDRICINGEPLKLLGYCRHEAHPEFGPVQPLPLLIEDLQYLRDLGCNFVRGTHYPQDQRFLDLCDEFGFLVWEESLAWGNPVEHALDPAFCDAQMRQTRLMIRNSFNHPSVILWGFLNEGPSAQPEARDLYDRLIALVRDEDPTRLVTYASFHRAGDLHYENVDVVCQNAYPGWYAQDKEKVRPVDEVMPFFDELIGKLDARGLGNKPFIISEFGAGAIRGWRDRFRAHWSEEFQAEMLDTICRFVLERPHVSGVAIWHFADAQTYTSAYALGRPRTINDKGTLDEYRRPKLAYDAVRRAFRNIR
jgi:beta-glucuronidase